MFVSTPLPTPAEADETRRATSMAVLDTFPYGRARLCRPCSACCIRLPVPAGVIGPHPKPSDTGCPHLCATGCRIYPRRHKICVDFHCEWLRDPSWAEEWRPDRSGLLCLREEIEAGLPAAAVYEILPGALQRPTAIEIVAALERRTMAIAFVDIQERRRCLLSEGLVHPAQPGPPRPHFLGPQCPRPDGPKSPRRRLLPISRQVAHNAAEDAAAATVLEFLGRVDADLGRGAA